MTFAAGQNNTSSGCTASTAPQWGAVKRAALRLGFSIASLLHCTRLRVSAHMMLTCIGRHSFWSYTVWVLLWVRLSQRPIYYCPPLQLDKPLTHRHLARSPRRPALSIVFPFLSQLLHVQYRKDLSWVCYMVLWRASVQCGALQLLHLSSPFLCVYHLKPGLNWGKVGKLLCHSVPPSHVTSHPPELYHNVFQDEAFQWQMDAYNDPLSLRPLCSLLCFMSGFRVCVKLHLDEWLR